MLSLTAERTRGVGLISSRASRTAAIREAAIKRAFLERSSAISDSVGEQTANVNPQWLIQER
jgi:hypothetical protein